MSANRAERSNDQTYRIQDLEEAYQELYAISEQKQKLLEEVSHDLRAPLGFITAYIDMLLNQEFGPLSDEQQEILQVVYRKTQQMSKLVKSLSNTDTKSRPPVREIISLAEIAADTIQEASAAATEAGLTLTADIPDDLPLVWVDPDQICRVFENLINNAIKFSAPDREITIRIRDQGPEEQFLLASVQDQGIGIAAAHHTDIWQRFFQVGDEPQHEGAGLGLAIVKELVEIHGGSVGVESALDRGSTFYFRLPYAPEKMQQSD